MDDAAIDKAARLLVDTQTGRMRPMANLPPDCAPATTSEAHAVQDRVATLMDEEPAAMKVLVTDEVVMRGLILPSRIFASPAELPPGFTRLCGVEAEIAFRFENGLAQRDGGYSRQEIADAVTALVVIEVVDTRFEDLESAPPLDKAADFLSNGGLVIGTARPQWQEVDLSALEVVVTVNGEEVTRQTGGHIAGDPILPAVALANEITRTEALPSGFIVTTGSFSGLDFYRPGDVVTVAFSDFGEAQVKF